MMEVEITMNFVLENRAVGGAMHRGDFSGKNQSVHVKQLALHCIDIVAIVVSHPGWDIQAMSNVVLKRDNGRSV